MPKALHFNLSDIKMGDERCTMANLILQVAESYGKDWFPDENAYDALQYAMVMLAMHKIHYFHKRAATPSDIARSTGTPRTTIVRKLNGLKRMGYVTQYGTHYELSPDGLNRPHMLAGFHGRLNLLKSGAQRLQTMLTAHDTAA
jgi:IclR helix-turn-helix domain